MSLENMWIPIKVILTLWISSAHGQVKRCDFPKISHGALYDERRYKPYFPAPIGKSFYYYCYQDYVSYSNNYWGTINCTQSGWEPMPTELCRKSCDRPVFVKVRTQNNGTRFKLNDRLDYECKPGYENREGRTTGSIVCGDNDWSDKPECFASTGKCGTPPPIANGDITSFPLQEYAPESEIEYKCQNLYKLEGDEIIRCHNGQWSQPPKCLSPCTISADIMNKHRIKIRWKDRNKLYSESGDSVEFTCQRGYYKTSREPFRRMCIDGKMTYPTCG